MKKFALAILLFSALVGTAHADFDPVTGAYRGPNGIDYNGGYGAGYVSPGSPYRSNASRAHEFAVIPQYDFNESLRWLIPQIKTEPRSYQSLTRPYGTPRGYCRQVNTGWFWNNIHICR